MIKQVIDNVGSENLDTFLFSQIFSILQNLNIECQNCGESMKELIGKLTLNFVLFSDFTFNDLKRLHSFNNFSLRDGADTDSSDGDLGSFKEL